MSDLIKFPGWLRERQFDLEAREDTIRMQEIEIEFKKSQIRSELSKIRNHKITDAGKMLVSFCAGMIFCALMFLALMK